MFFQTKPVVYALYLLKWLGLALLVGIPIGAASTLFLFSLDYVTEFRENHVELIAFLPLAGLAIGLAYHYWGGNVIKGNNQLLEEFHSPKNIIPFKMAPLVLFGTLITHLFGGSAGREGTAVQMGGAIADQFSPLLRLRPRDRKIILVMGISAGFASVFGTPLAGAVFALEVLILGRIRYEALLPSFFCALIAAYTAENLGVTHTHYAINPIPPPTPSSLLATTFCGIIFGLTARFFSRITYFWTDFFSKRFTYPPLRPFFGGIFIALAVALLGHTRYIGLGVPIIVDAFQQNLPPYDFLAKILFTSFTLGCGFKGGEVTPLFFIGATLGNALAPLCGLPVALASGIGFVAVFAGATNTPLACIMMGVELFGAEVGGYLALACVTAYFFSGHSGIYSSQIIGSPKHLISGRYKGKTLKEVTKPPQSKTPPQ
jgi:H+/Cl- antiporter ClcA